VVYVDYAEVHVDFLRLLQSRDLGRPWWARVLGRAFKEGWFEHSEHTMVSISYL
jgi:hypothetical protein